MKIKRGDIWLVGLDPAHGHEQKGHRPVLVVSADAFNQLTKTPVIVPITSGGNFARMIGFTVTLSGTRTAGLIRCDQPRVIDLVARGAKRLESVPAAIMDEVLAKVTPIFE
jgi:mRNA interferase ChpB